MSSIAKDVSLASSSFDNDSSFEIIDSDLSSVHESDSESISKTKSESVEKLEKSACLPVTDSDHKARKTTSKPTTVASEASRCESQPKSKSKSVASQTYDQAAAVPYQVDAKVSDPKNHCTAEQAVQPLLENLPGSWRLVGSPSTTNFLNFELTAAGQIRVAEYSPQGQLVSSRFVQSGVSMTPGVHDYIVDDRWVTLLSAKESGTGCKWLIETWITNGQLMVKFDFRDVFYMNVYEKVREDPKRDPRSKLAASDVQKPGSEGSQVKSAADLASGLSEPEPLLIQDAANQTTPERPKSATKVEGQLPIPILQEISGSWKVISIQTCASASESEDPSPSSYSSFTIGNKTIFKAQTDHVKISRTTEDDSVFGDRIAEIIDKEDVVWTLDEITDYIENNQWITLDKENRVKSVKRLEDGKLFIDCEYKETDKRITVVHERTHHIKSQEDFYNSDFIMYLLLLLVFVATFTFLMSQGKNF